MGRLYRRVIGFWPLITFIVVVGLYLGLVRQLEINDQLLELHAMKFVPGEQVAEKPWAEESAERVNLPHHWRLDGFFGEEGWYLESLTLNVPPNRLWGIYIPSIGANAGVYVNGLFVGSGGSLDSPPARNDFRPLYFSIANGLLEPGVNHIAIRVLSDSANRGYMGPVFLGPDEVLRPVFERGYFFRATLVQFIFAATLVSLFYVFMLAVKTRETDYAHFALVLLGVALFHSSTVVHESPVAGWVWDWIRMLGTGSLVVFVISFLHRYHKIQRRKLEYVSYAWLILGASVLLFSPIEYQHFLGANIWDVVTILWGFYALYIAFEAAYRSRSKEHAAIALSILVLLGAGIRDWLAYADTPAGFYGTLLIYAVVYPLVVFAWILLHRFTAALGEAQTLNQELEHRVRQKEQELASNYDQMVQVKKEQALIDERERIMRDMHDGIGGQLIAATTTARSQGDEELVDNLETALADLRLMIDSFEPVDNDLGTVLGLVRMRLERRIQNNGLKFKWQVKNLAEMEDLTPHKVLHVMRILEEAVTNIIRHAEASLITVSADNYEQSEQAGVLIEVIDDGKGIPKDYLAGRGLGNMRKRAELIGGEVDIESADQGTKVSLWLPLVLSTVDV